MDRCTEILPQQLQIPEGVDAPPIQGGINHAAAQTLKILYMVTEGKGNDDFFAAFQHCLDQFPTELPEHERVI